MFTENKFEICGHQNYFFMCCIYNYWVSHDVSIVLRQKKLLLNPQWKIHD